MKTFYIITLLLITVSSIQFSIVLNSRGSQCFYENVQLQTRYQILAKGNTSLFYLTVSQDQKFMHQDRRTSPDQPFKFYSAFSQTNGQVFFCIGNSQPEPILISIQFYHGLHLQDSIKDMQELTDIGQRLSQMQQFIERNYGMYQNSLQAHKNKSENFEIYLILAIVIIVSGTVASQIYIFSRTRKYLQYKKIL